jgi:hypothetical protein
MHVILPISAASPGWCCCKTRSDVVYDTTYNRYCCFGLIGAKSKICLFQHNLVWFPDLQYTYGRYHTYVRTKPYKIPTGVNVSYFNQNMPTENKKLSAVKSARLQLLIAIHIFNNAWDVTPSKCDEHCQWSFILFLVDIYEGFSKFSGILIIIGKKRKKNIFCLIRNMSFHLTITINISTVVLGMNRDTICDQL